VDDRTTALPAHLLRLLLPPAALSGLGALLAATASRLRRRARTPSVPAMSEKWLRDHERESGARDPAGFGW
jgi:hypothetical protein